MGFTMTYASTCSLLITLTLSLPLAAQTPVWQDDFEDGVVHPMWTLTQNSGLTVVSESGGRIQISGTSSGSSSTPFDTLSADLPALAGPFTLELKVDLPVTSPWTRWVGSFQVNLFNSNGQYLASIKRWAGSSPYQDPLTGQWISITWDDMRAHVYGGLALWLNPPPFPDLWKLERDAANHWTFNGAPLGTRAGELGSIVIEFSPCAQSGGAHPAAPPVYFEWMELYSGSGSPALTHAGQCPGLGTFTVDNATPHGVVAFGYGTPGLTQLTAGPCPLVVVPLASPILRATRVADANGSVSLTGGVPAAACGTLQVLALDVATCTMSNVVVF